MRLSLLAHVTDREPRQVEAEFVFNPHLPSRNSARPYRSPSLNIASLAFCGGSGAKIQLQDATPCEPPCSWVRFPRIPLSP